MGYKRSGCKSYLAGYSIKISAGGSKSPATSDTRRDFRIACYWKKFRKYQFKKGFFDFYKNKCYNIYVINKK